MNQRKAQFHLRMNKAIADAVDNLCNDFDISDAVRSMSRAEWQILRANIKERLFADYKGEHLV